MIKHPSPSCVVKVGGGRGFIDERCVRVVNHRSRPFAVKHRLIFTAAHCLPHFPPAHASSHLEERTYQNLLSSLNGTKKNVGAECLFADPIADIAVLGCPDDQALFEQADAYQELTEDVTALAIGKARSGRGWLLALDGARWIPTTLHVISGLYGTSLSIGPTKPGMSGSPILNHRGQAIGIAALGTETTSADGRRKRRKESGPQPMLALNLPGWLL